MNCHFFCCLLHWDVRCEGLPSSLVSLSTELNAPSASHQLPEGAFAQQHCGASDVGIWSVCTDTRSCRSIAHFCWLWALPVCVCWAHPRLWLWSCILLCQQLYKLQFLALAYPPLMAATLCQKFNIPQLAEL